MNQRKQILFALIAFVLSIMLLSACAPAPQPQPTQAPPPPTSAPQVTQAQPSSTPAPATKPAATQVAPTQAPPPTQPAAPAKEVVVNVATQDDLINLDPAKTTQAGDRTLAANIYSGLVKFKPGTTEIVSDLADKWTLSDDGLVYTFNLKKGIKFHGTYGEVTASDVKFSFERHFDDAVGSVNKSDLSPIKSIDVPDALTVKITLKEPTPGFMTRLAWQSAYILSQKAVTALGKDYGFKPIGTGAYMFSSWTPAQQIVLVANPDYFGGRPKIDKLVFKVIKDETIALLAFNRGEVDAVPVKQLGSFRQASTMTGVNMVRAPSSCVYVYYLNNTAKPFNDVRVRQAVNYALDKDKLAKTVDNMTRISPSVLSPMLFDYTADVPDYEYNPEKAKALLAEAGFSKDTKITINYSQSYLYEELSLILKDQLTQLGLQVEVAPVDRAVVSKMRTDKTYQILPGSITRFDTDQYLSTFFTTGASSNAMGYSNKKVDELIASARKLVDPNKRKDVYVQVQKLIAEDAAVIPVGSCDSIFVARTTLKGLYGYPYEGLIDFTGASVENK